MILGNFAQCCRQVEREKTAREKGRWPESPWKYELRPPLTAVQLLPSTGAIQALQDSTLKNVLPSAKHSYAHRGSSKHAAGISHECVARIGLQDGEGHCDHDATPRGLNQSPHEHKLVVDVSIAQIAGGWRACRCGRQVCQASGRPRRCDPSRQTKTLWQGEADTEQQLHQMKRQKI
eukprot:CAMPEP_0173106636 /NCGR_PEP_ID=MMETSP1102-20130122/41178_1 /TAXON_ID=49646 /ORGANISM="Geminigera sp., Strain Caron Lab Isolate" /LENGTH=176 /DNA_ID=CAMNT_0014003829 /DNA_START=355 /DNA_END=886 /DNA_ORIENTATION=-